MNGPTFEAGAGWGAKLGSWLKNNAIYIIPAVAIIILILILANSSDDSNKLTTIESFTPISTPLEDVLSEAVLVRDSYTHVARRLIVRVQLSDNTK